MHYGVLLKMTPESAIGIRVIIPFLRFLTWHKALFIVIYPQFVSYSAPLQKQFFIPLTLYMWGILALAPFVLLRFRPFYIFYILTFPTLLVILAYDYFIPYSYSEGVPSSDDGMMEVNGAIVYWRSQPDFFNIEDIFMAIIYIVPLPLAIIYRRCFPQWANGAKEFYENHPNETQ